MVHLVAVSLIWGFSFGLTKGVTAGLDPTFVAIVRLALAFLVFAPLLRWTGLTARHVLALLAIGAGQFGLMYVAYNASFRYLQAYEVALLTLTTPVLVTLLADALDRSFRARALFAALIAVAGTAVVVVRAAEFSATLTGVLLVQLSNAAFAGGQVAYRRLRERHRDWKDHRIFALLYAGGVACAVVVALVQDREISVALNTTHLFTLLYLGVIASGLGFFWWNVGATRVTPGVLAVMNNAKIPFGIGCALLFFGESADLPRLLLSLALLGVAVWMAQSGPRTR